MWRQFGEDTGSQILISLLIPFGAYLLAGALGCSGILAAVAAGVTMSYEEQTGSALAITRVRRTAVWETLHFGVTGVIFILLGEQLPRIAVGAAKVVHETGHAEPLWLAAYVVAIVCALAALRFVWAWTTLQFMLFRAAREGQNPVAPSWRLIAATALAGARGTVTLAGVLTLPLTQNDGSSFPARDLSIFLAAGVIIASLLAACILLPFLFRDVRLPPDSTEQQSEDEARVAASKAGVEAVATAERELADVADNVDLVSDAAAPILAAYRHRIEARSRAGVTADLLDRENRIERKLRLAGTGAERAEIYRLLAARQLSDETARKLVREIDLLETRIGVSEAINSN
jgi:CPA1 family monovalent cation:H+ antiporter